MVDTPIHPLLRDRVVDLPTAARRRFDEATVAMARKQLDAARVALEEVLALAPECVEAQRLLGLVAHMRGNYAEAVVVLGQALLAEPDNALLHMNLGTSLYNSGEFSKAFAALRRATELAADFAPAWFSLGRAFHRRGRSAGAITALHRALDLAPGDAVMRSQLAEAQASLGISAAACANYREVLRHEPGHPEAWLGLSRWQVEPFTAAEVSQLRQLMQRADTTSESKWQLGFALARGLEDQGDYHAAFRALRKANGQRRKPLSWNAAQASAGIAQLRAAFAEPPGDAGEPARGSHVVFIAGLPRSGAGLLRRVLAGHAHIDAADRSPHLRDVLEEESRRRQQALPQWAAQATPVLWASLGQEYLARIGRAHDGDRYFVHQGEQDWQLMVAAMAMLPGARLLDCRRDVLENCLSCYRQLFTDNHQFSYDLDELTSYWRDYDGLSRHWRQLYPGRIFQHSHEALLADPAKQLHEVMAFLQLEDDPSCLEADSNGRSAGAGHAARLREPPQPRPPRVPRYGNELDRLGICWAWGELSAAGESTTQRACRGQPPLPGRLVQ
ncbi:sulfotransferase [Rhodanobacter sp. AS-Z3]|uniref:tetratricopeptide repeat-containing sulfotransferase family protein n=1 Tax=Rhodanobacter sp. AS-Z3 TaxID=3031330 RepID=UPI00247889BA|nr:tetratricopeptide repeat-containing sulfotransferase family protein [Rhodanobacter sp. AS-Z3]WEN15278.1 sulfotransferase [Rhodanobacter sp. AS-Z3]